MFNNTSTLNLANNHIYVWINCGIVGLLATKASGGMRIRVAGASTADFKEWNVGGSDSWPDSVQGGWTMFVVDLEKTADAAGGAWSTTQANTAIQHIGYSAITATVMTRNTDNTWIDAIWSLADGTAGILVEGKSGGTTAWTWSDVLAQIPSDAGIIRETSGGALSINTPVQWFIDDATDHAFDSTNDIVLLDFQDTMAADLYSFTILGAVTGSSDFTLGVKTGTGDAATGGQGMVMASDGANIRYTWDTDGANIDTSNFYGCSFIGGSTFAISGTHNEWVSNTFIDCGLATVTNALMLRGSVINPNIGVDAGTASMETDDMTDIRFCTFSAKTLGGTDGNDGHAVELITPLDAAQTSKGNKFTGFDTPSPQTFNTETGVNGTTEVITLAAAVSWDTGQAVYYNDKGGTETIGLTDGNQYWVNMITTTTLSLHTSAANANSDTARVNLTASGTGLGEVHELGSENAAVFNDQAGAVTISVTDLGDGPSVRNGIGASTTVSNDVNVTVTVKDEAGAAVNLAQVWIAEGTDPDAPGTEVMNADTNASGIATTTYNFTSDQAIMIRIRKSSTGVTRYVPVFATGTITSSGFTLTRTIVEDTIATA
jgi:hypothetical protein